ncbi:unnamed protein product [Calypogeia fissa]
MQRGWQTFLECRPLCSSVEWWTWAKTFATSSVDLERCSTVRTPELSWSSKVFSPPVALVSLTLFSPLLSVLAVPTTSTSKSTNSSRPSLPETTLP